MSIEYTEWFPPEVAPVRNGLYLLKRGRNSDCWHMGYWNGKGWYGAESANHGHCTEMDLLGGDWNRDKYHWRGLTHNAELRGAEPIGEASRSNDVLGADAPERN